MSMFHRRSVTLALLVLLFASSMATTMSHPHGWDNSAFDDEPVDFASAADSPVNLSIPYVDTHYGYADGIIDPTEYSRNYTDSATGMTVFFEHDSSILYVGLSASTSGWLALGWKNQTGKFSTDGLNGSDLVYGTATGTPLSSYQRVTPNDVVTVDYKLYTRNGTLLEEGSAPGDDSETPIGDLRPEVAEKNALLNPYIDQIIGMRIGEQRHFIIPAEKAYNDPRHPMYGKDLEYVITLRRINYIFDSPANQSSIEYSDEYGISTFQHLPDTNQSRILSANASLVGGTTQVEYFVRMNSTDPYDIPLYNTTDARFPFVLLRGPNDDFSSLPVQHTEWTKPLNMQIISNTVPVLEIINPEPNAILGLVTTLKVNASDDGLVRRCYYRVDDGEWIEFYRNFKSDFWESKTDLSDYDNGTHTIWFNATDASNVSSIASVDVIFYWPQIPLLGMRLRVSRTVSTLEHHQTKVEDTFSVRNNGSAPINSIEVFLPTRWEPYFLSISATDANDREIEIVRVSNEADLMHWRLHFFEPVSVEEIYNFTSVMYFHSLHTFLEEEGNIFELSFLRYPVVPYVLRRASLTTNLRSGDSLASDRVDDTTENLEPMTCEMFTLNMSSYTPYLTADRSTNVKLNSWGWLVYTEEISIHNIGTANEDKLAFEIPAYASGIRIHDKVGILADSQKTAEHEFNESVELTINLQSDRFGEGKFKPGWDYTFKIDYFVKLDAYTSSSPGGSLLELPMGTLSHILVEKHTVDLVLSTSISVVDTSGNYRLLYGAFDTTLRYTVFNTTQYNPPEVRLVYNLAIGIVARPLIFAFIIGLVATAYVSYRKIRPKGPVPVVGKSTEKVRRQVGAPPELLREFADMYSRKTALEMDLEKLQASRRRGKVSKKEYMIREKDIKSKLEDIDSELPSVKDELISHGSKYRDMIAQLEMENEKVEGAKAGLRQLLRRKKKQRISRAAFEKSRQDYLKTIKEATSAIDRILLSIEEAAGEM
ncbi:MAG: FKBP-type peptidyl-prolyl cis-trans isomerase [Candidatus Thorarchaeota archaeon]|nr:FKBP-type peptidyl-prolyl cis-trans isomerase [Candidatus Thorarchaeota archaeon]